MESCLNIFGTKQQLSAGDNKGNSRVEFSDSMASRSAYLTDYTDEEVICPKPRRATHFPHPCSDMYRAPLLQTTTVAHGELEAGSEILNIFFHERVGGDTDIGRSPPYFCGSPPIRSHNPLIHDAQFHAKKLLPAPSALSQQINCGEPFRIKAVKQSPVRIEGFASAGRKLQHSIPAQA